MGSPGARARLRAEAFKTDTPLKIKVKCYEEGHEKETPENKPFQGKIQPPGDFTVEQYESQDLDCIFADAGALGTGPHAIVLDTTFRLK